MMRTIGTIAIAATLIGIASAQAATIESIVGSAQVNAGNGFQPALSGTPLPAGAQVMISPKGSAQIRYSGDCSVSIAGGQIWKVLARPPCNFEEHRSSVGGPGDDVPVGIPYNAYPPTYQSGWFPNGIQPGVAMAGFGVVVGTAVGIAVSNSSADDAPSSP